MPPKVVKKPWGREEWLELNQNYCMKKLFINDGKKLSLQYHKKKTETMCLVKGSAIIHYNNKSISMVVGDWIHISPGDVHMLEGEKDCCIIECSSPEVDDVVRLKDHYNRS